MGVGVGVLLLVAGAIIFFALEVDIPYVDNQTLGIILMAVGVLAIVLALIVNQQRANARHPDQRRYDDRGYDDRR